MTNMAPNLLGTSALFLAETTTTEHDATRAAHHQHSIVQKQSQSAPQYRWQIVWRNVAAFMYLHIAAVYGLWLLFFGCKWPTFAFSMLLGVFGGVGVTAGAHRLWAHKTYKAKLPLRIILMSFQTLAFQNHIYEWVRDHRVHHKFTDTDADPHNAQRGFFFSHIGWLMLRKHKDVFLKGRTVDMSDLEADGVVQFQRKFYFIVMPLLAFILPTVTPWYYWGEKLWVAWYTAAMFRYVLSLHGTWLVNSAAHIWGTKPYDKSIGPTENIHVAIGAFGEGWHNYHHVFPWDYKAAELGNYKSNITTMFIDGFAKIGWAYDMKTVPIEMVKKRVKRTGDGTRTFDDNEIDISKLDHHQHEPIWGWGDVDMNPEDVQDAQIYNRSKQE